MSRRVSVASERRSQGTTLARAYFGPALTTVASSPNILRTSQATPEERAKDAAPGAGDVGEATKTGDALSPTAPATAPPPHRTSQDDDVLARVHPTHKSRSGNWILDGSETNRSTPHNDAVDIPSIVVDTPTTEDQDCDAVGLSTETPNVVRISPSSSASSEPYRHAATPEMPANHHSASSSGWRTDSDAQEELPLPTATDADDPVDADAPPRREQHPSRSSSSSSFSTCDTNASLDSSEQLEPLPVREFIVEPPAPDTSESRPATAEEEERENTSRSSGSALMACDVVLAAARGVAADTVVPTTATTNPSRHSVEAHPSVSQGLAGLLHFRASSAGSDRDEPPCEFPLPCTHSPDLDMESVKTSEAFMQALSALASVSAPTSSTHSQTPPVQQIVDPMDPVAHEEPEEPKKAENAAEMDAEGAVSADATSDDAHESSTGTLTVNVEAEANDSDKGEDQAVVEAANTGDGNAENSAVPPDAQEADCEGSGDAQPHIATEQNSDDDDDADSHYDDDIDEIDHNLYSTADVKPMGAQVHPFVQAARNEPVRTSSPAAPKQAWTPMSDASKRDLAEWIAMGASRSIQFPTLVPTPAQPPLSVPPNCDTRSFVPPPPPSSDDDAENSEFSSLNGDQQITRSPRRPPASPSRSSNRPPLPLTYSRLPSGMSNTVLHPFNGGKPQQQGEFVTNMTTLDSSDVEGQIALQQNALRREDFSDADLYTVVLYQLYHQLAAQGEQTCLYRLLRQIEPTGGEAGQRLLQLRCCLETCVGRKRAMRALFGEHFMIPVRPCPLSADSVLTLEETLTFAHYVLAAAMQGSDTPSTQNSRDSPLPGSTHRQGQQPPLPLARNSRKPRSLPQTPLGSSVLPDGMVSCELLTQGKLYAGESDYAAESTDGGDEGSSLAHAAAAAVGVGASAPDRPKRRAPPRPPASPGSQNGSMMSVHRQKAVSPGSSALALPYSVVMSDLGTANNNNNNSSSCGTNGSFTHSSSPMDRSETWLRLAEEILPDAFKEMCRGKETIRLVQFLRLLKQYELTVDLEPFHGLKFDRHLTGTLTFADFEWIITTGLLVCTVMEPLFGPRFVRISDAYADMRARSGRAASSLTSSMMSAELESAMQSEDSPFRSDAHYTPTTPSPVTARLNASPSMNLPSRLSSPGVSFGTQSRLDLGSNTSFGRHSGSALQQYFTSISKKADDSRSGMCGSDEAFPSNKSSSAVGTLFRLLRRAVLFRTRWETPTDTPNDLSIRGPSPTRPPLAVDHGSAEIREFARLQNSLQSSMHSTATPNDKVLAALTTRPPQTGLGVSAMALTGAAGPTPNRAVPAPLIPPRGASRTVQSSGELRRGETPPSPASRRRRSSTRRRTARQPPSPSQRRWGVQSPTRPARASEEGPAAMTRALTGQGYRPRPPPVCGRARGRSLNARGQNTPQRQTRANTPSSHAASPTQLVRRATPARRSPVRTPKRGAVSSPAPLPRPRSHARGVAASSMCPTALSQPILSLDWWLQFFQSAPPPACISLDNRHKATHLGSALPAGAASAAVRASNRRASGQPSPTRQSSYGAIEPGNYRAVYASPSRDAREARRVLRRDRMASRHAQRELDKARTREHVEDQVTTRRSPQRQQQQHRRSRQRFASRRTARPTSAHVSPLSAQPSLSPNTADAPVLEELSFLYRHRLHLIDNMHRLRTQQPRLTDPADIENTEFNLLVHQEALARTEMEMRDIITNGGAAPSVEDVEEVEEMEEVEEVADRASLRLFSAQDAHHHNRLFANGEWSASDVDRAEQPQSHRQSRPEPHPRPSQDKTGVCTMNNNDPNAQKGLASRQIPHKPRAVRAGGAVMAHGAASDVMSNTASNPSTPQYNTKKGANCAAAAAVMGGGGGGGSTSSYGLNPRPPCKRPSFSRTANSERDSHCASSMNQLSIASANSPLGYAESGCEDAPPHYLRYSAGSLTPGSNSDTCFSSFASAGSDGHSTAPNLQAAVAHVHVPPTPEAPAMLQVDSFSSPTPNLAPVSASAKEVDVEARSRVAGHSDTTTGSTTAGTNLSKSRPPTGASSIQDPSTLGSRALMTLHSTPSILNISGVLGSLGSAGMPSFFLYNNGGGGGGGASTSQGILHMGGESTNLWSGSRGGGNPFNGSVGFSVTSGGGVSVGAGTGVYNAPLRNSMAMSSLLSRREKLGMASFASQSRIASATTTSLPITALLQEQLYGRSVAVSTGDMGVSAPLNAMPDYSLADMQCSLPDRFEGML